MLDGRGDALGPVPAGDAAAVELRVGEAIDDDVAVEVTTSGTTAAPKGALLTAAALTASATATHDRLGGPGRWLLALPAQHIAGLQVLVRSALAGTTPVEMDVTAGFDVAALPAS
ncbi:AMP-binding protein, partial [Mycobacterium talmoniae]|uniref:AMP-binding protein n=1 Tax=Mycobacterium talmoniae TaxID=1858794 RepID=UPI003BF8B59A